MPISFTKQRAYEVLSNNGITDVLLHFTNRGENGEVRPIRQWTASRGKGVKAVRIAEGRYLVEVVRDVIRESKEAATSISRAVTFLISVQRYLDGERRKARHADTERFEAVKRAWGIIAEAKEELYKLIPHADVPSGVRL